MKTVTTLDNKLEVTSTYKDDVRNVSLKDLSNGNKLEISGNENSQTFAGFEVMPAHGEIHLIGDKGTVIIQKDGQVQSPTYRGSISSSMTVDTVAAGQTIVGVSIGNIGQRQPQGNISSTITTGSVGKGQTIVGVKF